MTRRVLVVDDAADMRLLIRRMLGARGYHVDLAETLAQARSLDPSGYDAVLVDAQLGPECGSDLVEWLRARDPVAAARCLLISGGAAAPLPAGVACLPKPFGIDDLLTAVRAIESACGTAPVRQPCLLPATSAPRSPTAQEPASRPPMSRPPTARPPAAQPGSGAAPAWRLLGAVARSRAAERQRLADFLHDGPIQDLTAAVLELQLISQPGGAGTGADPAGGTAADAVLRRLAAVTGSLRWLVDRGSPDPVRPGGVAAAVQEHTAELLAIPATVEVTGEPEPAGPGQAGGAGGAGSAASASEAADTAGASPANSAAGASAANSAAGEPAGSGGTPLIADLVGLMLTEIGAAGLPALAHVAVRLSAGQTRVELTLRPTAGQGLGQGTSAEASIGALAGALGAEAAIEFSPGQWRARLTLTGDAA